MLERIIAGIIIGLITGYFHTRTKNKETDYIAAKIVMALIIVAFAAASLMFGVTYFIMAIGEIALGIFISSKIFSQRTMTDAKRVAMLKQMELDEDELYKHRFERNQERFDEFIFLKPSIEDIDNRIEETTLEIQKIAGRMIDVGIDNAKINDTKQLGMFNKHISILRNEKWKLQNIKVKAQPMSNKELLELGVFDTDATR